MALEKYLPRLTKNGEIIVVDDGSPDRTAEIVMPLTTKIQNLKFFQLKKNRGKGGALKFGFQKSAGKIIVFMDAGGDFPAGQLKNFLRPLALNQADIVIGNKWDKKSRVKYALKRKIFSKLYHFLVQMLFHLNISDTQVGLKAFNRSVLKKLIPQIKSDGYIFDLELLILAKKNNCRITEQPVALNWQRQGGGIKLKSIVKMIGDTCALKKKII